VGNSFAATAHCVSGLAADHSLCVVLSVACAPEQKKAITAMCQQFTLLYELSSTRYVAQCEHGTVHLRWEAISIHLSPTDFFALHQLVAEVHAQQTTDNGKLRLGIGNVTLEFRAEDCPVFLGLLRRTVAQLTPAPSPILGLCPQHAVLPTVHSLN